MALKVWGIFIAQARSYERELLQIGILAPNMVVLSTTTILECMPCNVGALVITALSQGCHSNIRRICINEYCPMSKLGFLQKSNICSVFGEGPCEK